MATGAHASSTRLTADRGNVLGNWVRLALGLAALWLLTFVILPLGQRLPVVEPVMQAIVKADIKATQYWYTQSEETAYSAMYLRHTLEGMERRKHTD
jgi:hypothetical protein